MTPEEQRIAIAEACGWRWERLWTGELHGKPTGEQGPFREVPDYLNDINAMHEAEAARDLHHDQRWIETLVHGGLEASGLRLDRTDGWDWALVCARATAAQRAEAFLKTLNLWKA